ncbi:uncharacterized protein BdWA1_003897 [Babesia duncani]|uniref:RAP domain-containing protein n=1 Tax=Babesia duncani TaxID=323732 RepID=A0AAD9PH97_9APIC|nr:hypothetical protein BdWA1_003897 [Babesia duncani]
MKPFSNACGHAFCYKRRRSYNFAVKRKPKSRFNTILSDSIKIPLYSKLPKESVRIDFLNDAFLGFRKHSFFRFVHLYSRFANDLIFLSENRTCIDNIVDAHARIQHQDECTKSVLKETVLGKYMKNIPFLHLLLLFNVHSKCLGANQHVSYAFMEAISIQLSRKFNEITNFKKNGYNVDDVKNYSNQIKKQMWNEYAFLFQSKDSLTELRSLAFSKDSYTSSVNTNGILPKYILSDAMVASKLNHELRIQECNKEYNIDKVHVSPDALVFNPRYEMKIDALDSNSMLSNHIIACILSCIFNIKHWPYGFPFDSWINQYFIQNCNYYHPLLLRLYIKNILALYDFKKDNEILCDQLFQTLKKDLVKYNESSWTYSEVFEYPEYMYLQLKTCYPCFKMVQQQIIFAWYDMIDIFSLVKRFGCEVAYTAALKCIPPLVETLKTMVNCSNITEKHVNCMISICSRNDSIGGCDELLDALTIKALENIESLNISDVSTLLFAIHKNNMYNQDLIDALCSKLSRDLSQFSLSSISQCIQIIGRIQPQTLNPQLLPRLAEYFLNNENQYKNCSEAFVSNILWGFQRLHFYNSDFLKLACSRYNGMKRGIALPNVNSLVISLTSLARMEAFDTSESVLDIYKLIQKGIPAMTLSTCQQIMGSIVRILDSVLIKTPDNESNEAFISQSNKLMIGTCKHVVEHLLDQIGVNQASSMLMALFKCRLRLPELISPLLASLAGYQKSMSGATTKKEWTITNAHAAKKSLHSYTAMPPCPFNIEDCKKRLEQVDASHLTIKDTLEMQLHDMRAIHILSIGISFSQWDFKDYHLQGIANKTGSGVKKKFDPTLKQWIPKIINDNKTLLDNRRNTWFENKDTIQMQSNAFEIREILLRQQWKERMFMGCIEGLQRHLSFLSGSSGPLKKAKVFYDLFVYGIYINHYPDKIMLQQHENPFMNIQHPFLVLEHYPPFRPDFVSAILPQNLLKIQAKLYSISRTESYHNYVFNQVTDVGQMIDHTCNDVPELEIDDTNDEFKEGIMPSPGTDITTERIVPNHSPLCIQINTQEDVDEKVKICMYKYHRGSGAIVQICPTNHWIYVDPVIGGYRSSILLLNGNVHYIPHINQGAYKNKKEWFNVDQEAH